MGDFHSYVLFYREGNMDKLRINQKIDWLPIYGAHKNAVFLGGWFLAVGTWLMICVMR